ncbi:MAG: hypothetical protein WCO96_02225 [Actinomycetes bacterium]
MTINGNVVQAALAASVWGVAVPAAAAAAGPESTIPLTRPGVSALSHSVGFAANGTKTVVWAQIGGTPPYPAEGQSVQVARISKRSKLVWQGRGSKRKRVRVTSNVVTGVPFPAASGKTVREVASATTPAGVTLVAWIERESATGKTSVLGSLVNPGNRKGRTFRIAPNGTVAASLRVGASPSGAAWVVWRTNDGSNSWLEGARVSPSGAVSATKALSDTNRSVFEPGLAVRSDGSAQLVWRDSTGVLPAVRSVSVSARGTVGSTVVLNDASRPVISGPAIALAGRGTTAVAWAEWTGSSSVLRVARLAASGRRGSTVNVTGDGEPSYPSIGVDSGNTATVAWRALKKLPKDGPEVERVRTMRLGPRGTKGAIVEVGPSSGETLGSDSTPPALIVSANGVSTLAWSVVKPGDVPNIVYLRAVKLRANGRIAAAANLVPARNPDLSHLPSIGAGSNGTAAVAYLQRDITGNPWALKFVAWP